MTATTRSVLILAATLLVGGAVGAVTTGTVMNKRLDELQSLRTRGGFMRVVMEVINPADEARRQEVGALLRASGERMSDLRSECVVGYRTEIDSLRAQLDPLLTTEEHARLQAFLDRDREGRRRGGERRRGPREGRRPPGTP